MKFGVIPKHKKVETPQQKLKALQKERDWKIKRGESPSPSLTTRIKELEAMV